MNIWYILHLVHFYLYSTNSQQQSYQDTLYYIVKTLEY